ncbi:hypothetical protein C8R43DRAFT_1135979 [Mycena crocata]|nr:hypothetical protein C8R43DRAFT_1135979 [Mycena crocata]
MTKYRRHCESATRTLARTLHFLNWKRHLLPHKDRYALRRGLNILLTILLRVSAPAYRGLPQALENGLLQRLRLVAKYDCGNTPSMRACDSIQCSKIPKKSAFLRSQDWRAGDHRTACEAYGTLSLGTSTPHLTTRDRSFLRTPVHSTYMEKQAQISAKELTFMNNYPGMGYLVLYDYTAGAPKVSLQPLDSPATMARFRGPELLLGYTPDVGMGMNSFAFKLGSS